MNLHQLSWRITQKDIRQNPGNSLIVVAALAICLSLPFILWQISLIAMPFLNQLPTQTEVVIFTDNAPAARIQSQDLFKCRRTAYIF